jgi:hypothetical protein
MIARSSIVSASSLTSSLRALEPVRRLVGADRPHGGGEFRDRGGLDWTPASIARARIRKDIVLAGALVAVASAGGR